MKTTYFYVDQLKDQYGNLLVSWGVYEKIITLESVGAKPSTTIKLLMEFDSLKKAQDALEKFISNK